MTDEELVGYYRAYETVAHGGIAEGAGLVAGSMSGNPVVGMATGVAVEAVLNGAPEEVKYGAAIGAGLGGISAIHVLASVGGVALAPALGVVALGAAALGTVYGGLALVAKACGLFDE